MADAKLSSFAQVIREGRQRLNFAREKIQRIKTSVTYTGHPEAEKWHPSCWAYTHDCWWLRQQLATTIDNCTNR
jgi:hypothetical protein